MESQPNISAEINVEIVLKNNVKFNLNEFKTKLDFILENIELNSFGNAPYSLIEKAELQDYVVAVNVEEPFSIPINVPKVVYHSYIPYIREMELETFDTDEDGDEVPSSSHWILPSQSFIGLWENLIYENGIKEKILKFGVSALKFAQHNVSPNVISNNRLILLHGPPGTGKSSLCKALAQKLSIRLKTTYKCTHLIEINSHSLFSKWFSESGKLVMKLFSQIKDILAQPNSLVCVLIDEIESLAYARSSMSGQEPKDAMRVVNALLTQLDSIKNYANVIILATSNIASTIDLAFIDRADIKQYIGLPSIGAIYKIYTSMLIELMKVKIIEKTELPPCYNDSDPHKLMLLSKKSVNLSGRALRKIPFLAHAMFLTSSHKLFSLDQFLNAINSALDKHISDEQYLNCKESNH